MSGSLWRYSPQKCDGDYCCGECDNCPKEWEDEDNEAFEVLNRLSAAYEGKQMYFLQSNGLVYSRYEGEYQTLEDAIDDFARRLSDE